MRTTVDLDADVTAAVQQLRRDRGVGLSEAVNELVRAGVISQHRPVETKVRLSTRPMHLRIDVSNVAEALDVAGDGPPH